jgi:uncharacterized protein (DUF1800 family)
MRRLLLSCAVTLTGFLGVFTPSVSLAQTGDFIFNSKFDDFTLRPSNASDASRFLTQATFGPTPAEITRVQQIGYSAWIDEQIAAPASLTRPWLLSLQAADLDYVVSSGHRVDRWAVMATTAPDQLRQRMAFALSQIFVVSDSGGMDTLQLSEYQDILTTSAFGTYRNLLGRVTFSPMMGQWLTYVRNRAAYVTGPTGATQTILPDENYAREVMQLFSFGLVKRNLDFSLTTTPATPTYDNNTIAQLSRVFTGLSFTGSTSFYNTGGNTTALFSQMSCFPMQPNNTNYLATGRTYHDNASKTIFDNISLPAVADTEAGCLSDINAALDAIANHSSTAPYISRQLIQRFVTSNPSPQYIGRVSQIFVNNGSGVRGDLAAVIRAVLLDPEARRLPRRNEGKLREPLLRLTAAWRANGVAVGAPEPDLNANGTANTNVGNIRMDFGFTFSEFGQRPYSSPTVFNFYVPDYQAPGALDDANLFSPEFQILNETTVARMNNLINELGAARYVGLANLNAQSPRINLDDLALPLAAYNAGTQATLVDTLNLRLMNGYMSNGMRQILLTYLAAVPAPTTDDARRQRVRDLLRLIYVSPEFAVQK